MRKLSLVLWACILMLWLCVSLPAFGEESYREFVLATATVATATGNGSSVDRRPYDLQFGDPGVRVVINTTAATGTTPSMTPSLQGIMGDGTVVTIASGTAITAAGVTTFTADRIPALIRLSWVITGTTPSFTFTAWAIQQ
jgi:hypothetical protein